MFERKITTSMQFTESQLIWLEKEAENRTKEQNRKVSKSEINREAVNSFINSQNKGN